MDKLSYFKRFIGHFKTITKHRILVKHTCYKAGLYKQGFLHDLSKYSYKEFHNGVKYYQGYRSPIDKEREENNGISNTWFHHYHHNKHHWEYWIDKDTKSMKLKVIDMPLNYLLESTIDRISACKVYNKENYTDASAYNFLMNGKDRYFLGDNNFKRLEILLSYLKENGEEKALKYYKELYRIWKKDNNYNI